MSFESYGIDATVGTYTSRKILQRGQDFHIIFGVVDGDRSK